MFCEEPIIAAYEGCNEIKYNNANSFFDCFNKLSYHLTVGYRIILETEHYYISIEINGVKLIEKKGSVEELQEEGEYIEPYIHTLVNGDKPWIDYESTLFVGERLLSVDKTDYGFLLHFDDFELRVIPHDIDKDDIESLSIERWRDFNHVYGCERLITRRCECGGTGELLLDYVSDYVVRCNNCKQSTFACQIAVNAIKEWNSGNVQCDLSDIFIWESDI